MSRRLGVASVVALLVGLAGARTDAAGPSFDCAKASNWAEKQICGDDKLAAMDAWLSPLYNQVVQRVSASDADALRAQRKAWFKARNECKADQDANACLARRYQEFIGDLEHRLAATVAGAGAAEAAAPAAGKSPLEECGGSGGDRQSCLEQLLDADETRLADAEATARKRARDADKVAASNAAWRGYRNAECKRRSEAASDDAAAAAYTACLIELTRARVTELGPS